MFCCLYILLLKTSLFSLCMSQYFENEIFKDGVDIHSRGTLRRMIDLDEEPYIKKISCERELIQIIFNKDVYQNTWKKDDIVVGRAKWGCNLNSINHEFGSIFAKVLSTKMVGRRQVDLVTTSASPVDLIEEAFIVMKYDSQIRGRRKVRTHNNRDTYTDMNGAGNWTASLGHYLTSSRFHYGLGKESGKTEPTSYLDVRAGSKIIDSYMANNDDFKFVCYGCEGKTLISYRLEVQIQRKDRKPVLRTFLSQVEIVSLMDYNISLSAAKEISINSSSGASWGKLPMYVTVPLSSIKGLPELELVFTFEYQIELKAINVISDGAFSSNIEFQTTGRCVFSEYYSTSRPITKKATPYSWVIDVDRGKTKSGSQFSALMTLSKTIKFKSYIEWEKRNMEIEFGSPLTIRLEQDLRISTKINEFAVVSPIQGETFINVYSPKGSYYADIFTLPPWYALVSDEYNKTMLVLNAQLNKDQQANCHFVPAADEENYMQNACGTPRTKITRNSPDFEKLIAIWDEEILFLSEEADESKWCGTRNRPCVHCYDTSGGDICADRLMLPSMADAIRRLSKFVKAEWPHLSIVVIEAWDEPTSKYPNGKHGKTSLFYEGRAAMVTLGELNSFGNTFLMLEGEDLLERLRELAVCAEFDFAELSDDATFISMCLVSTELTYGLQW